MTTDDTLAGPGAALHAELVWRTEDGARLPALLWRAAPGLRMVSSALVGGGIGPAGWVLNAQVPGGYSRMDPVEHLGELAEVFGLTGPGVGMLTAAAVEHWTCHEDEGVGAAVTVGLRVPTWAAAPSGVPDLELAPERLGAVGSAVGSAGWRPGTINIIVSVPVALTDAALVNAVVTATEAKTQGLLEAGYDCTGTASDAVCVAAPDPAFAPAAAIAPATGPGAGPETSERQGLEAEAFAGPRSLWGARIARAVRAAVHAGAVDYTERMALRPPAR